MVKLTFNYGVLEIECADYWVIILDRSAGISDLGILAISRGCIGLEMINIAYCNRITDNSFISISKCSKLNTLESRGCPLVTSLGLAAVAVGCKQLTTLDIKNCHNIDDAGMIPLAHFLTNLKQVTTVSLSLTLTNWSIDILYKLAICLLHR